MRMLQTVGVRKNSYKHAHEPAEWLETESELGKLSLPFDSYGYYSRTLSLAIDDYGSVEGISYLPRRWRDGFVIESLHFKNNIEIIRVFTDQIKFPKLFS